jgi:hypothetical protein
MAKHQKRPQVIPETPPTASVDAISTATKNISKDEWLDWALAFAQGELERGMLAEREYWRLALKQFLMAQGPGVSGDPEAMTLASDAQLRQTQQAFQRMIRSIMEGQTYHLGVYTLEVWISVRDERPWLIEQFDVGALPDEVQAQYTFARLLDRVSRDLLDEGYQGPLIRSCPAPQRRRKELCGRWFVGRPNRLYCSPHCQNRATTRASRARRQQSTSAS